MLLSGNVGNREVAEATMECKLIKYMGSYNWYHVIEKVLESLRKKKRSCRDQLSRSALQTLVDSGSNFIDPSVYMIMKDGIDHKHSNKRKER